MKNNKGKKIKIVSLFIMLLTVLCIGTSMVASAEQTSKMFIRSWQVNTISNEEEERTATTVNKAWQVKLTKSDEKQGTVTSFWLVDSESTNKALSSKIDAALGKPFYDGIPYSSCQGKTVRIAAENNTFNNESYSITCVWNAQRAD